MVSSFSLTLAKRIATDHEFTKAYLAEIQAELSEARKNLELARKIIGQMQTALTLTDNLLRKAWEDPDKSEPSPS